MVEILVEAVEDAVEKAVVLYTDGAVVEAVVKGGGGLWLRQ